MDSPKCPACFAKGRVAQTYKLAGLNKFICRDCHQAFDHSQFEPVAFLWKNDPKQWNKAFGKKGTIVDSMQADWAGKVKK